MKKMMSLLIAVTMAVCMVVSLSFAGGGKVQHERGAATAPGPGDDARGNQA